MNRKQADLHLATFTMAGSKTIERIRGVAMQRRRAFAALAAASLPAETLAARSNHAAASVVEVPRRSQPVGGRSPIPESAGPAGGAVPPIHPEHRSSYADLIRRHSDHPVIYQQLRAIA